MLGDKRTESCVVGIDVWLEEFGKEVTSRFGLLGVFRAIFLAVLFIGCSGGAAQAGFELATNVFLLGLERLGRVSKRGPMAALRETWYKIVKMRNTIMRTSWGHAVPMAKRPMRQISER